MNEDKESVDDDEASDQQYNIVKEHVGKLKTFTLEDIMRDVGMD